MTIYYKLCKLNINKFKVNYICENIFVCLDLYKTYAMIKIDWEFKVGFFFLIYF